MIRFRKVWRIRNKSTSPSCFLRRVELASFPWKNLSSDLSLIRFNLPFVKGLPWFHITFQGSWSIPFPWFSKLLLSVFKKRTWTAISWSVDHLPVWIDWSDSMWKSTKEKKRIRIFRVLIQIRRVVRWTSTFESLMSFVSQDVFWMQMKIKMRVDICIAFNLWW
jgi:hypothetical protein